MRPDQRPTAEHIKLSNEVTWPPSIALNSNSLGKHHIERKYRIGVMRTVVTPNYTFRVRSILPNSFTDTTLVASSDVRIPTTIPAAEIISG